MIERVCGVCGKTFQMSQADQANWLSAWGADLDDVICPECLDYEYHLMPKIPQWIEDIDWEPVRNVNPDDIPF